MPSSENSNMLLANMWRVHARTPAEAFPHTRAEGTKHTAVNLISQHHLN